jgi:hypothetical protein
MPEPSSLRLRRFLSPFFTSLERIKIFAYRNKTEPFLLKHFIRHGPPVKNSFPRVHRPPFSSRPSRRRSKKVIWRDRVSTAQGYSSFCGRRGGRWMAENASTVEPCAALRFRRGAVSSHNSTHESACRPITRTSAASHPESRTIQVTSVLRPCRYRRR